tara:strand:+ start:55 stop:780 length:726 start_codon:yes stop_codon:yes gene_type:complete
MSIVKFNRLLFLILFLSIPSNLNAEELILKSFGHSQFLIKGEGKSILINPFKAVGCASQFKESNDIKKDLILASSRLFDEGYNPTDDLMFVDPGTYEYDNFIFNGISVPHDRLNGRRYGNATVWTWKQSNFKIVHMGGAAGPITFEDQILINRPDILFISIGGGVKTYTSEEALNIIKILNPKIIIPVHFLTTKKEIDDCDFSNEDDFIKNMSEYKVKYIEKKLKLNSINYQNKIIYIFRN